jgi:hypothetical protein
LIQDSAWNENEIGWWSFVSADFAIEEDKTGLSIIYTTPAFLSFPRQELNF